MFQAIGFLTERNQAKMSMFSRHIYFYTFFHNGLLFQAIGNHITNRDQLQIKFISHLSQLRQACHATVLSHDFHKGTCRIQTCHTSHVNRSFCVSGTTQDTFLLGIQRIDMSRTSECCRCRSRIGQCPDGSSTVGSRNSGSAAFQFIDSHRERCAQYRSVVTYLMG